MTTEFHVYPAANGDALSIVMDIADPQKAEILECISALMNRHERPREADECLDAVNWGK